jgi:hypothetical protein
VVLKLGAVALLENSEPICAWLGVVAMKRAHRANPNSQARAVAEPRDKTETFTPILHSGPAHPEARHSCIALGKGLYTAQAH